MQWRQQIECEWRPFFLSCRAVYLHINALKMQASGIRAVNAEFEIEVLKAACQCGPGRIVRFEESPFGKYGFGSVQLVPLDQLQPTGSPYLSNDRLMLRVKLAVLDTVAA